MLLLSLHSKAKGRIYDDVINKLTDNKDFKTTWTLLTATLTQTLSDTLFVTLLGRFTNLRCWAFGMKLDAQYSTAQSRELAKRSMGLRAALKGKNAMSRCQISFF